MSLSRKIFVTGKESVSLLFHEKLSKALLPSIGSKFVTVITSWVLLPLLAVRIGPERLGVYALYLSMLSLLNIADSGLGSAVVRQAATRNSKDMEGGRSLLLAAIKIYGRVAAVLVLIAFAVIAYSHSHQMKGAQLALLFAALAVVGVQVALMPVGRFYAGVGLLGRWNTFAIYTNLIFMLSVACGLLADASSGLALLILGHAVSLALLPIMAGLGLQRHPKFGREGPEQAPLGSDLWREARVQIPIIVSGVVQREVPKWAFLGVFPTGDLGRLGLLLTVLGGIGGLIGMFTSVLWPQIIAALHNGDHHWARRSRNFLYALFLVFGVSVVSIVTVLICLDGKALVLKNYVYSEADVGMFGLFSILVIWEHIHYSLLLGMNQLKLVARISMLQAVVALAGWWLLPIPDAMLRYLTAQIVAYALCSSWVFPMATSRKL